MKTLECGPTSRSALTGLLLLLLALPACGSPGARADATVAATACPEEFFPPRLTAVEPVAARAGAEIQVIGSGGFFRDACGGYNESARAFPLFLDGEPLGQLGCYINHCEGSFTIPAGIAAGLHCLSLDAHLCSLEIQILDD